MPIKHSSEKRLKAISLRKSGKSLRSIVSKIGVSLSTIQSWVKHIELSVEQKDKLVTEHQSKLMKGRDAFIVQKTKERISREFAIERKARAEFEKRKKDSFFIAGLALYWAEGFKKDHSLGFVNSDPAMLQLFLRWLKKYNQINIQDIHPRVQIHSIYEKNIKEIEQYWSNLLQIPSSQFRTPFYQTSKSKPDYADPNYRGLLRIRVSGARDTFLRILCWMGELRKLSE